MAISYHILFFTRNTITPISDHTIIDTSDTFDIPNYTIVLDLITIAAYDANIATYDRILRMASGLATSTAQTLQRRNRSTSA
jgi:hypothetical protein